MAGVHWFRHTAAAFTIGGDDCGYMLKIADYFPVWGISGTDFIT